MRQALHRALLAAGSQIPDPLVYFNSGEAGGRYRASRFQSAFTTQAGSTNVASAGDPIGRLENLANASPDLTQVTDANRPTLARSPRSGIRGELQRTEDFDNGTWVKFGTTSVSNVLTEVAASSQHNIAQGVSRTGQRCLTVRVAVVAGTRRLRLVNYNATDGAVEGIFNLQTGAVQSGATASIEDIGGGIYECTIYATTTVASTWYISFAQADGTFTYLGDGTSQFRVYRAWDNAGSSKQSYQAVTGAWDVTEPGQPSVWLPYFDGSNDYLTTGVQSFGSASLFADAGQEWTVWGVFRSVEAVGRTLVAKAGASTSSMTLQVIMGPAITIRARGVSNIISVDASDGLFHTFALRWNSGGLLFYFDDLSPVTITVGTASEESQDITLGCRTAASPAGNFSGRGVIDMIDRALSDAEVAQLMAYLNNTYRFGL